MRRVLLLCFLLVAVTQAFYLPGVAPEDYKHDAVVTVKAEKLNSVKTQLPFEYYSLPFCEPEEVESEALNLGEVMHGSRVLNTPYKFRVLKDEQCSVLCARHYSAEEVEEFADMIDDDYRVTMLLDNLPLAMVHPSEQEDVKTYELGYPIGEVHAPPEHLESEEAEPMITLNNHLRFTVLYHSEDDNTEDVRIVGFEVEPLSINHEPESSFKEFEEAKCSGNELEGKCGLKTCSAEGVNRHADPVVLSGKPVDIIWSYEIHWKASDIKWASRWDAYLQMQDEQVHWFSIINSFMIVIFLSGLVAMILIRALKNDLDRYEHISAADDGVEETGWKLVHGDVFRPPQMPLMLCVYVGTGVQLGFMAIVVSLFALLGFLSPANRGSLMSTILFLFAFMGVFGGYHASRLYKMFKGRSWKKLAAFAALMLPGAIFVVFFILNLVVWSKRSSAAIPFGTLVALLCMWFFISAPLVFLGSYFGSKKQAIDNPVRTTQIPRSVPAQPWYMHPLLTVLMGGVLPFGAVFVELFFILTSVWRHQFYYLFGFLFLVLLILALTCGEITIVMCYFQLCTEDYHWWWRSFLTSGSCAFYLFGYSVLYFATQMQVTKFVTGMLFFGYMLICSYVFFVVTGTIGFFSAFFFVRKIYSSIKVD